MLPQERRIRSMLKFSSARTGDPYCDLGASGADVMCQGKRCVYG